VAAAVALMGTFAGRGQIESGLRRDCTCLGHQTFGLGDVGSLGLGLGVSRHPFERRT